MRIVTKEEGTDEYSAIWLVYAMNGATVSYVVGETWDEGPGSCPTNYDITFAREFRYDDARERYLNRELDTYQLLNYHQIVAETETWSDYDGGYIYGDYTLDQATATETMSYESGLARTADPLGTPATDYYHTDHLGTTRLMGDDQGIGIGWRSFTAFGEHVAGLTGRYDYAGAWGYQTHDDFPYLHVGARYYDPATGRFLQRDPIGINGGRNVYEYVGSRPLSSVDPSGLGRVRRWVRRIISGVKKWAQGRTGQPGGGMMGPIDVTARALEAGPNIVRLKIATDRRRPVLDCQGDLGDCLDSKGF